MRRVVLLAIMALALPTAALANSIDFSLGGGTMSVTPTSASVSTGVVAIGICNPTCTFTPASGTASIVLPSFNTTASGTFGAGGSISISSGAYSFTGSFVDLSGSGSPNLWSVVHSGKTTAFAFIGYATGTLTINGKSVQTTLVINSGQTGFVKCKSGTCTLPFTSGNTTIGVVPEPGTLGLLGTGLVGLAGIVRRRFHS